MKPRKRNGNSLKKFGKKNNSPNITEIDEIGKEKKDKKSKFNAFNRIYSEMDIYSGQIVPLNVEKIELNFQEFKFRPFTLSEIYKIIDNLDNNKAPGPEYINAWALKFGKHAIGTHLQIIFNDCFHKKVFPTIRKHAHITPFSKKEIFKKRLYLIN